MSETCIAMGIDISTLALHVTYGPGPQPYRLKFTLDHLDPEDRAVQVAHWLEKLLQQIDRSFEDLQLSIMVIEKPFLGMNVRTLITLTQIQAACIVTCQLHDWFAVQEDPNKIRKHVLGVGTVKEKGGI
jgi:Holliday junction resolvasome RuvABC endonuclease subunit